MKKYTCWLCCLVAACSQPTPKEAIKKEDSSLRTPAPTVVNPANNIPLFRDSIQSEPVASYKEKTDNPLNDWYFAVKLYETPKTFHYRIHLQYEEIEGDDTLKLPNFGIMPEPVIQKGPEKYSCIIGFNDRDGQFREYKKVFVKDDHLKITALKHYAVATYEK